MTTTEDPLVLRTDDAVLTIDPRAGGRFSSFVVAGHELLVTEGPTPIDWGCYAMAPFAGRIRDGRFTFRGQAYQLETTMPPNAIHGTVYVRPWAVTTRSGDRAELTTDLGPGWPFRGRVTQSLALAPGRLDATLTLDADEPMPAWLGWHPWFRRALSDGARLELAFEPDWMYARGVDGLPTGELVRPSAGPWDDAFGGVARAPRLTWAGVVSMEIRSAVDVWVVYDERPYAVCVEPQTAPPDAVNLPAVDVPVAEPGRPMSLSMTWAWSVVG